MGFFANMLNGEPHIFTRSLWKPPHTGKGMNLLHSFKELQQQLLPKYEKLSENCDGSSMLSPKYFDSFAAWLSWQLEDGGPAYPANEDKMSIRSCKAESGRLWSSALEKPQDPLPVLVFVLRIEDRHASRLAAGMLISGCCWKTLWIESSHCPSSVRSWIVSRVQNGEQNPWIRWFICTGIVIQVSCLMVFTCFNVLTTGRSFNRNHIIIDVDHFASVSLIQILSSIWIWCSWLILKRVAAFKLDLTK